MLLTILAAQAAVGFPAAAVLLHRTRRVEAAAAVYDARQRQLAMLRHPSNTARKRHLTLVHNANADRSLNR